MSKESRRVRIPKRNVCCDNYFLFWEIATSIGYLQNTKHENIKQNKTKQKSLDLVQLDEEKGEKTKWNEMENNVGEK